MINDTKPIIAQLSKITSRGYRASSVFDDWLSLMIYAFAGNHEEEYLEIVRRYRNDKEQGNREIDFFANALGKLMVITKQTNEDCLGQIYMEWNISNKYSGQFFTPSHIAGLMADIVGDDNCGNVYDPTCGSGTMLIEKAKRTKAERLEKMEFVGQDLDLTCAKMCALNLMFFNLNGHVMCGDTLAEEVNTVFVTRRTHLGGMIHIVPDDKLDNFRPVAIVPEVSGQLGLFG